jgi:hypothetical protein
MITGHRTAVIEAFLGGGVLVGGITGDERGSRAGTTTTTTSIPRNYLSSAEYSARYAWAQSIPMEVGTTLSVPIRKRVTIAGALHDQNGIDSCSLSGTLSGVQFGLMLQAASDAASGTVSVDVFNPVTLDSGSISCLSGSGSSVTSMGYLTTPEPGKA